MEGGGEREKVASVMCKMELEERRRAVSERQRGWEADISFQNKLH